MAFTDTILQSYAADGAVILTAQIDVTADAVTHFHKEIPTATTNGEADLVIDVSTVKMAVISSDQDVTLKTNSTGSPTDTITLAADHPLLYYTGGPDALAFTGDVTKVYITNTSGSTATVVIRVLYDSTPVLSG